MITKRIILIGIIILGFGFYLLAQGPPPPPSQGGGGGPAGVPLDGASGMLVLGALGALYKKYASKKKAPDEDTSDPSSTNPVS